MKKSIPTLITTTLLLASCTHQSPMPTVGYVDIDRFMGDWYVVANIPTYLEKGAHNAIESYRRNSDGSIATTFSFLEDGFDGKRKEYQPTGYIEDTTTNATWGMRFVWPFKADYRIVYLNDDYTKTVIGRSARDYVWVMARSPQLSAGEYSEIKQFITRIGYDPSKLELVPQKWPGVSTSKSTNRDNL